MNSDKNKKKFASPEDQESFLRKLLEDDKADNRILEWGGFLALENRYWDIAENIFSCLLERRKKVIDLFCLGNALMNQFKSKDAEECFLEAIRYISEPCFMLYKIHKYLGHIYVWDKNYPMAEEYYNKAYTLNPHSLSLQFHRGLLKIKEKNYKESENLFEKLVKTFPESKQAWLGLAISRYFLEDKEIAIGCLSRCLDLDPHYSKASYLKEKWTSHKKAPPIEDHFKFSI